MFEGRRIAGFRRSTALENEVRIWVLADLNLIGYRTHVAGSSLFRERSKMRLCTLVVLLLFFPASLSRCEELPRTLRVASISFEPVKLDLAGNADQLEAWFRKAANGGAKIAVAPEGSLDGYIVNEIIAKEMAASKMRDVAVAIDSPVIRRFQSLARELNLCLVFGFAEQLNEDVFNTAVFIDNSGEICGKYQKMQFHEGYDPSWWFNRLGKRSRAFDTPYGRCGILICNDRWNPLLAKIPALDGAQFLVIPAYGSTSNQQDLAVLDRSTENKIPIVEANVGVSLIVSQESIVAVERKREAITFGEIVVPPTRAKNERARDQSEADFLQWRSREMPERLIRFLQNVDPRGAARDQDVATLETAQLKVIVGTNRSLELNGVSHRPGYNGIFSLASTAEPDNPFVPAYAGMNLEHYFDSRRREEREVFFEPRYAPMALKQISEAAVELYQRPTPVFQVESWSRFTVREPNAIDFSFRCVPHRSDYVGGFLGVFWASYINGPLNKSMYFIDGESTLVKPLWRQLCTQQHNRDSTVCSEKNSTVLDFEERDTLFASVSPLRYAVPCFYGRFRDMVLIYLFRPNPNLRFTHSPSGGGTSSKGDDTNPAWDVQLIIPQPVAGREYELVGRLIYKKWDGRNDVLNEIRQFYGVANESSQ